VAIRLVRDDQNDVRTLGAMFDGSERICETLELPWRGNKHNVSCIPFGTYECRLAYSPSHKRDLYWIHGVPERDSVEIHIGNTVLDTKGCILVGKEREKDMVVHSREAFNKFMAHMGGANFILSITKEAV
jgi:hypothetical protein